MILTHLEDNNIYDDDYIIKIPKDLYENGEIITIVLNDIENYGSNRRGTLIIDKPYKYLNKLKEFYGGFPSDVDGNNVDICIPFEDSASNKNILKYFMMGAFSLLSDDQQIYKYINMNYSEEELDKNINYISFKYGRYKYNLSLYQLKIIYTISTYALLSEGELKLKFRKIGYGFVATKYGRWFSIKYYIPLFNRNIPEHLKINWVLVKNPKDVLSLLTDNEILDVTDNYYLDGYRNLRNRYELINFVYENMKNMRFRYIGRDIVVSDRDEIYGSEFLPYRHRDRKVYRELTYGIQSTDVGNANMKCINENSLAEYFNSRKGFYAPYNNNKLSSFDVNYLLENTRSNKLKDVINNIRNRSNKNLINNLYANNSENVIDFIRNLFYSGMYIRRWKGIGHEYPLNYNSAGISICAFFKSLDPEYLKSTILSSPESFDDNIVESIKNNNFNINIDSNAYLQYSFENYIRGHLEKLRKNIEIQSDLGFLLLEGDIFSDYYTKLMNSELCIRVSSRYLILLAWELAKSLSDRMNTSYIIPNFTDDMANNLEYISVVPRGESENPTM